MQPDAHAVTSIMLRRGKYRKFSSKMDLDLNTEKTPCNPKSPKKPIDPKAPLFSALVPNHNLHHRGIHTKQPYLTKSEETEDWQHPNPQPTETDNPS